MACMHRWIRGRSLSSAGRRPGFILLHIFTNRRSPDKNAIDYREGHSKLVFTSEFHIKLYLHGRMEEPEFAEIYSYIPLSAQSRHEPSSHKWPSKVKTCYVVFVTANLSDGLTCGRYVHGRREWQTGERIDLVVGLDPIVLQ